jgi:NAD(P)-dependent dehydrogenase (short-subunit alcohol dehydrogenase family)
MPVIKQTAAITGAARGIGRAIALQMAAKGYDLYLTSEESEQKLRGVKAECHALNASIRVETIRLDLAEKKAGEEFINQCVEVYGGLSVLVCNAGVRCKKLIGMYQPEDIDNLLAINFRAAFMSAQAASKIMAKNGAGKIIFIASDLGLVARAESALYGASKAALIHLAKSFAVELASKGVSVNAVSPGSTATETNIARMNDDPGFERSRTTQIPANRFASMQEIAEAVVFLAGANTTFIQGTNLVIDGGYTAR